MTSGSRKRWLDEIPAASEISRHFPRILNCNTELLNETRQSPLSKGLEASAMFLISKELLFISIVTLMLTTTEDVAEEQVELAVNCPPENFKRADSEKALFFRGSVTHAPDSMVIPGAAAPSQSALPAVFPGAPVTTSAGVLDATLGAASVGLSASFFAQAAKPKTKIPRIKDDRVLASIVDMV